MDSNFKLDSLDVSMETKESSKLINKQEAWKTAQIRLVSSHPEVYEPCVDSFVLVDSLLADRINLLEHNPSLCMEIGSGSGYVITSLALMLGQENSGIHYFATDVNPHAVAVTQQTLESHGVHAEIISTDLASGLVKRLAGMVDVIVVNPPYVPTPEEEVGSAGITSAWAGGYNGRRVIDRILPVAHKLLSEQGWLYMVTLADNNPMQICTEMKSKGYESCIILQRTTDEEKLLVLKFWKEGVKRPNRSPGKDSWFCRLPFWRNCGSNI